MRYNEPHQRHKALSSRNAGRRRVHTTMEDRDIKDVMAEESSRRRRQPKKLMTVERKRRIQRAAARLADTNCSQQEFLEVIRELGYEGGSQEFDACVKLWNSRRH